LASVTDAHCKIIGGEPPPSLLVPAGLVPDVRPHLAAAAVVVTPFRTEGGTRLKIVEAIAMGKTVVSICAEGGRRSQGAA
jgi:hypothetical protein